MRRRHGTDLTDEQLAWQAVHRRLGASGPDAKRACQPAVAAALAYLTDTELTALRRKGKVPTWFLQEVRNRAASLAGTGQSADMPAGMMTSLYDGMTDAVASAGAQWADPRQNLGAD
jgi:hypothetical protein